MKNGINRPRSIRVRTVFFNDFLSDCTAPFDVRINTDATNDGVAPAATFEARGNSFHSIFFNNYLLMYNRALRAAEATILRS